MRSWFLSLLEILVVGKGLIVFITSSNSWYNIIWKSLSGKNTMNMLDDADAIGLCLATYLRLKGQQLEWI